MQPRTMKRPKYLDRSPTESDNSIMNRTTRTEGPAEMTKFTAFYPQMVVHTADCADALKEAKKTARDCMVTREATDLWSFLGKELEADLRDMGYDEGSFEVKPCAAAGAL